MTDENEEMKVAIDELIQSSPVVAHCKQEGCEEPIRQAELDLRIANTYACSDCCLRCAASVL